MNDARTLLPWIGLVSTLSLAACDPHDPHELGLPSDERKAAPPPEDCLEDLTNAVVSGELPGFVMTPEGVAQFPPLQVSCEDLLAIPVAPPGNTVSHGQAICNWKVASGPGQLDFVVWEGPGEELLCGCKCPSCGADGELASEYDAQGSGSQLDPYVIRTPEQVIDLAADPTGWDDHFVQCQDIDLAPHYATGDEFVIGIEATPFSGSWDGKEHALSGYQLTAPLDAYASGMFAVASEAVIRDLTFTDALVELDGNADPVLQNHPIGALVGHGDSVTIERVEVANTVVKGRGQIGGLAGRLYDSTMEDIDAETVVMGTYVAGGVLGIAKNTAIEHVTANADVSYIPAAIPTTASSGYGVVFGLVYGGSVASHCQAEGTVDIQPTTGGKGVGGLGGRAHDSSVAYSAATTTVTGGGLVGGLLGEINDSDVSWSFATGDVTSTGTGTGDAAGLIGHIHNGTNTTSIHIRNSYSTGDVVGAFSAAGFALVGINVTDNPDGEPVFENCYAAGDVFAQATGQPWDDKDAAAFMLTRSGAATDTETSFALGLAGSAAGPSETFHFTNYPSSASNFYDTDAGTPVNAAATGPQPASEAAGDFAGPNAAPLSMAWPTGPGQWDLSGALPTIPSAGN